MSWHQGGGSTDVHSHQQGVFLKWLNLYRTLYLKIPSIPAIHAIPTPHRNNLGSRFKLSTSLADA